MGQRDTMTGLATVSLAKTTRPSLLTVVMRERLFATLEQALERPIVWVSGPPGSGKTTLVSSYLESRGIDHLWYQLDPDDADPATFFHFMAGSVAKHLGAREPSLPRIASGGPEEISVLARRFFRALFGLLKGPFVIVLDNFQEVSPDPSFRQALDGALAEIPNRGHIVVISRAGPSAHLARHRANQRLFAIGWEELRLTRDEAEELVALRGQSLSDETLDAIYARTEGWAAGIVLMLGRPAGAAEIEEGAARQPPRVVFDYLAGELFETFEPATRAFLTRVACLPEVTVGLAQAVAEEPRAKALLVNLSQNNYFVTEHPAGPETVYRFHPLFRAFLLGRAEETLSGQQKVHLYRKAAEQLERMGEIEEAIRLLIEVEAWRNAAVLIAGYAPEVMAQGRTETLRQWMDQLPGDQLRADPWMIYWSGACRSVSAPRESRHYFERAFDAFTCGTGADAGGALLSCCGVMDAILDEMDDLAQLDRWIDLLHTRLDAQGGVPDNPSSERITSTVLLALSVRRPDHPALAAWQRRALDIVRSKRNPDRFALRAATAFLLCGRTPEAWECIEHLREAPRRASPERPVPAHLYALETVYQLLLGEQEAAFSLLDKRRTARQAFGARPEDLFELLAGAACHLAAGDHAAAHEGLKLSGSASTAAGRLHRCLHLYLEGWGASLAKEAVDGYQRYSQALGLALEIGIPALTALCRLATARAMVLCGEERKHLALMRRVQETNQATSNPFLEYATALVDAELALGANAREKLTSSLKLGMRLGRERGFTLFPGWLPESLKLLCATALERGIEREYVRLLIRKRRLPPPSRALRLKEWPWPFRIESLGRFRVSVDEVPQAASAKGNLRPIAVLKALIALGGREVKAVQVAEALWPNIETRYAQNSLTINLHRLRKLFGDEEAFTLRDGRLSLDDSRFWLDTWAFEQVADEIEVVFEDPERPPSPSKLTSLAGELFELYKGPLLDDDMEVPLYRRGRERLRERLENAGTLIGGFWEREQAWERAADIYRRGLKSDPCAERFYQRLMICQHTLGRDTEMAALYAQCRENLAQTPAEGPSEETRSLFERLKGGTYPG